VYACLHLPGSTAALIEVAGNFSPLVEDTGAGSVLCDVEGLGRLIGTPAQIAAALEKDAAARGLRPNVAIASTPDTALLVARHSAGTHVIEPGRDAPWLGPLPVSVLGGPDELLETLGRWGIRTLAQLAALPPIGLAERLGEEAARLRLLALGQWTRPLHQADPPEDYTARMDLENPIPLVEPLLFCISSLLNDLTHRLKRQALAVRRMTFTLTLTRGAPHVRTIEFPLPTQAPAVMLKQAQLDLEAHPPPAAVRVLELRLEPASPRTLQGGLFRPATPEPDKLQVTIARIAALVGPAHVGSPELLDTYRPDAYSMRPMPRAGGADFPAPDGRLPLRACCRIFRPALSATVRVAQQRPVAVTAHGIRGAVRDAAGPWRTTGEWWASSHWARDEWDVDIENAAVYRIYYELDSARWFVGAMYD
jgi:protein ImuB